MSASGWPWKGATPPNVTNPSLVNLEDSPHRQQGGRTRSGTAGGLSYNADYTVQGQANVMENMYSHRVTRLQEQANAEPSELNRRYNTSSAKNTTYGGGPYSSVVENPEVYRMGQTSTELLMSQSRKAYQPNFPGSIYGGELTSLQVHGTTYSIYGLHSYKMMTQTPLELPMSQTNVRPQNVTGSGCHEELTNVPSSQVHGHKMIQKPLDLLMSRPNILPQFAAGSTYYGELTDVKSLQVHGTAPSIGTDDDLPPPYINSSCMRGGGRVNGNKKGSVPASSNAMAPTDMEAKIHLFEQEAYCLVFRAFQAQSDTITWEKEGVLTDLREQLRVSDYLHRELLKTVRNDGTIRKIREWRSTRRQASLRNNHQPIHDTVFSPTKSSCKRRKTSQSGPALPAPSPAMCSQQSAKPDSSIVEKTVYSKGANVGPGQKVSGGSAVKSMASSGGHSGRRPYHMNTYFTGDPAAVVSQAQSINPLIGHKVKNRWPDDNKFYEAVISDYGHVWFVTKFATTKGQHKLVYAMNTSKESWEWIDLKKRPDDIRWLKNESGIDHLAYLQSQGAQRSGVVKPTSHGGPISGSGRGREKAPKEDVSPPHNGAGNTSSGEILIFHTKSLIEEVEKVCSAPNPDPLKVDMAKKALKEQEMCLIHAIARLAEVPDDDVIDIEG